MIFRNFAFVALVVTSTTLNCADADRTKLRGRMQVGNAKDAAADATVATTDGLRHRGLKQNGSSSSGKKGKKDDGGGVGKDGGKKDDDGKKSGDAADRAKKQFNPMMETAVVSNYADLGLNSSPAKDNTKQKNEADGKQKDDKKDDKKGGKNGVDKNKKDNKDVQTGPYANTFNYAAVKPQAWNPSAVTLGSAQPPGNTNYASPGAATGNLIASTPVGAYNVNKYEVGTQQQQQQQPQPVPVISNHVPNTNQNQLIPIAPPANTANNGQGKVIATSTNRGQSNSAITTACSIADGCCSSGDCPTTGCCNFQYGCVDEPTDLPWMASHLPGFCM